MKHTIIVEEYNEFWDLFTCRVFQDENTVSHAVTIPAFLFPYFAQFVLDELEDLPHDLVGVTFTINKE